VHRQHAYVGSTAPAVAGCRLVGYSVVSGLPLRSRLWRGCRSASGIGFTLLLTRSSPSRHPPFTQYPSPSRSLVRDGQTSPHKPRLVVLHSTCPSLSPSPPAHSFIIGTPIINTHTASGVRSGLPCPVPSCCSRGRVAGAGSGSHSGVELCRSRTRKGSSGGRKKGVV
jgi:hypothetical protein